MKYCRYCGEKLFDEDKFCPSCGSKVEESVQEKVEEVVIPAEPVEIICPICGSKAENGEINCSVCGALLKKPIYNKVQTNNVSSGKKTNSLAVAGFVISIFSMLVYTVNVFGSICAIAGIIFSVTGMSKAKREGGPKALAIVGLCIGCAALFFSIVWLIFGEMITEQLKQMMNDLSSF